MPFSFFSTKIPAFFAFVDGVGQEALSLSLEEAQEALVTLLDSRAKGILENVKADAIERRDARILVAAERLLK